jgi:energy-coupling factor transport system ATP-binding protein
VSTEAFRLQHLSFSYPGQHGRALDDVSLLVNQGEMLVVMGATGAGKSTLAKCLNRAVPGFQSGTLTGSIAILGRELHEEGVADLAGVVGLVSQDFESQLFATNVLQEVVFGMEQLGVPPGEMQRRVPRALEAVGLLGFERRDPATLSGGEKQRLAIAATLALQPSILVFDEPTTDLDPLGKLEVFAVLATMHSQGYTLIVIDHEVAAAERADRLIVLSQGRVIADDSPAVVLSQVDFLRTHGIRPPDLSAIAARLQLAPPPRSIDEAEAVLRPRLGSKRMTPDSAFTTSSSQPTAVSTQPSTPPVIQVEGVGFQYDSGAPALAPALAAVSLTICPGEFIAMIGQNGSGKTTLAKHLNGLLTPTTGRVLLLGRDLRELRITQVAAEVGYVFQNPDHQIFAATVHDEVAFGPRNFGLRSAEIDERVSDALQAVGLSGLEAEDPFLLSKGHRQRLAVASVLALHPRVLILDEPTTGLDYAEQRRMMDLLARLHDGGLTILMITHSPWVVAEYAQRGVLMAGGRLLFDGPLRTLFAEEALLERAHFRAPDATRLGRRLGFTPLSVEELLVGLSATG